MSVHIPPVLVIIACKTVLAGAPDPNAAYTKYENLDWATPNAMMTCRREEVQLYDPSEGMKLRPGDDPTQPLNPNFAINEQCAAAGIALATQWNLAHSNTPYRVWRVGCPAPIIDKNSGIVIGYKLPECGHADTVICETDSAI